MILVAPSDSTPLPFSVCSTSDIWSSRNLTALGLIFSVTGTGVGVAVGVAVGAMVAVGVGVGLGMPTA